MAKRTNNDQLYKTLHRLSNINTTKYRFCHPLLVPYKRNSTSIKSLANICFCGINLFSFNIVYLVDTNVLVTFHLL